MKVKMVQQISGLRNGEPWPGPGEVVELSEDEAQEVLISGQAVAADQKHEAADAAHGAAEAEAKAAEDERKAAVESAKADAKAAADQAAADQKAAEARAAAEGKVPGAAPLTTSSTGLAPGEEWDATAAAQAHAKATGVDLGPVKGTGAGGTVTKADVQAAADKKAAG